MDIKVSNDGGIKHFSNSGSGDLPVLKKAKQEERRNLPFQTSRILAEVRTKEEFSKIFCGDSNAQTKIICKDGAGRLVAKTEEEFEQSHTQKNGQSLNKIASVLCHPFKVGLLHDIFPADWLQGLKQELDLLEWKHRSNDLYDFYQTNDLTTITDKSSKVNQLYKYLKGDEFITFMEHLSGTKLLRDRIDMAAQQYKNGGYLLCHDDSVSGQKIRRKIAYILYLVEADWKVEHGGCLGLFSKDENNQPVSVVKKNLPVFNTMAFFITGDSSYHEVQEVLRDDGKSRWSVTGWFYENVERLNSTSSDGFVKGFEKIYKIIPEPKEIVFYSPDQANSQADGAYKSSIELFVNDNYLSDVNKEKIQEVFLGDSSIELKSFLKPQVYTKLVDELCTSENWRDYWKKSPEMPPIVRRYYSLNREEALENTNSRALGIKDFETCESASTPGAARSVIKFLESRDFAEYLSDLTGLELTKVSSETRMFTPGCYTLVHDKVCEPEGLDVVFSFMQKGGSTKGQSGRSFGTSWNSTDWDGTTHYIADQDELLTVEPDHNTISIVYRTSETKRFVKYVKSSAEFPRCEISLIFLE